MNKDEMPAGSMTGDSAGRPMPSGDMATGQAMPELPKRDDSSSGEMPNTRMGSTDGSSPDSGGEGKRVLVELRVQPGARSDSGAFSIPGLNIDPTYAPVPMKGGDDAVAGSRAAGDVGAAGDETVIVRATVDPSRIEELKADPNVVQVWSDGKIAPFSAVLDDPVQGQTPEALNKRPLPPPIQLLEGMAACPIGTCDCAPGTPKGTIGDVAAYLGVNAIWTAGKRGEGIVVGVVDGGIRAAGRTIKPSEAGRPTLNRVIGGFPAANWGTTAANWSDHGMMCGTDVLGMAPNAQLYDLRISDGDTLSVALAAFQWAINQHRANGTPQVLSNSWGMFQQNWAPDYTTNANHPFTRKVIEAIDEGIIVLFAAG
ncbi:MAG: S8 family serine peptidase, partial [Polaromonas sp.]